MSPVSTVSSQTIYDALKACDIRLISALPETWLVHLVRMAEDDPAMTLVRLAKEEEGVGISAGAHLAGVKSAMLMQNHGFLAAINGIVSCAQLYRIPLLMLISYRGDFGERDPWQTEGGASPRICCARCASRSRTRPRRPCRAPHPQGADARALRQQAGRAVVVPRPDVGGGVTRVSMRCARFTVSSRTSSSSRSWARWPPNCSRSAIDRISSICSTRWASLRRWAWASRWRGPIGRSSCSTATARC